MDLYFGPSAPAGHDGAWIKTIPGKGWFAAFSGSWKPGDFQEVR
jgi:hypothetical protein